MGKVISLADRRKKDVTTPENLDKQAPTAYELCEKANRIQASINRINKLMEELRTLSKEPKK